MKVTIRQRSQEIVTREEDVTFPFYRQRTEGEEAPHPQVYYTKVISPDEALCIVVDDWKKDGEVSIYIESSGLKGVLTYDADQLLGRGEHALDAAEFDRVLERALARIERFR